ncbi:hypothetical protein R3W88_005011 [Solanum pinnatisectum]|uniref:DDE Tnp4 domain-containing protein n=1 Tax=Solanum pinnatisectum TaxID=50273 RepID=A0AAV9KAX5_9SOLN|nr:hypothetical protein R3W88_005011 [Solanum pinnatisectum]
MRFIFVAAGWEGTAHDSKVLENALVEPTSQFPFPPHDKYYVVNAGFRNTKGFLAPYKGLHYHLKDYRRSEREPQNAKELFNCRHSSLHNVIEQTFGTWKNRFRILKQGMNHYDINTQVIIACAVLHNYLREYQSTDEIFMVYEQENIVADDIDQQMAQSNNVGSSSRSHDREMQVQHEKIVRTMSENYIKD